MAGGNPTGTQVLHNTRVWQGVEITAHYYRDTQHPGDGCLETDPAFRLGLHDDVVEFVCEHECLDELHIGKLWVPVNVGVCYQDVLTGHV